MCKHRTAFFVTKLKGLSRMICTTGCHQPFWKNKEGKELSDAEAVVILDKAKGLK